MVLSELMALGFDPMVPSTQLALGSTQVVLSNVMASVFASLVLSIRLDLRFLDFCVLVLSSVLGFSTAGNVPAARSLRILPAILSRGLFGNAVVISLTDLPLSTISIRMISSDEVHGNAIFFFCPTDN